MGKRARLPTRTRVCGSSGRTTTPSAASSRQCASHKSVHRSSIRQSRRRRLADGAADPNPSPSTNLDPTIIQALNQILRYLTLFNPRHSPDPNPNPTRCSAGEASPGSRAPGTSAAAGPGLRSSGGAGGVSAAAEPAASGERRGVGATAALWARRAQSRRRGSSILWAAAQSRTPTRAAGGPSGRASVPRAWPGRTTRRGPTLKPSRTPQPKLYNANPN